MGVLHEGRLRPEHRRHQSEFPVQDGETQDVCFDEPPQRAEGEVKDRRPLPFLPELLRAPPGIAIHLRHVVREVAIGIVIDLAGQGPEVRDGFEFLVDRRIDEPVLAAVESHDPVTAPAAAALLATADDGDASPFAGYRLTGFTNAEEEQAGLADKAKWLLQDRLIALGADFREGAPWGEHVVVDRNLFTGQNPASSGPLAEAILKALSA